MSGRWKPPVPESAQGSGPATAHPNRHRRWCCMPAIRSVVRAGVLFAASLSLLGSSSNGYNKMGVGCLASTALPPERPTMVDGRREGRWLASTARPHSPLPARGANDDPFISVVHAYPAR
jgi:hypothetical protein